MLPFYVKNKATGELEEVYYTCLYEKEYALMQKSLERITDQSVIANYLQIPKDFIKLASMEDTDNQTQNLPLHVVFYCRYISFLFSPELVDTDEVVYSRRLIFRDNKEEGCVCIKYLNAEKQKVAYAVGANDPITLVVKASNIDPAMLFPARELLFQMYEQMENGDKEIKLLSREADGPFSFPYVMKAANGVINLLTMQG